MISKPMRVGVIGCGSIGSRYANWLHQLGVVVGVHDKVADRMNIFSNRDISIFTDIHDLFHWGVNKTIVATPPLYHREAAILSMSNGADVLVEKPLATNIIDAEAINIAAKQYNKKAWGVCNMRFHPAIKTIKQALVRIGRPLYAHAYFSHRLSQMRPTGLGNYSMSSADGGGVILDCIHEIDLLQWLLGSISRIRGWSEQIGVEKIEADDIADLQIKFSSGCHCSVHFDFLSRLKRRGLEIVGTDATISWQSIGRSPENCHVILGDNNICETLLTDSSLNGDIAYREMLSEFLTLRPNLQNVREAWDVLEIGLAASNSEWTDMCQMTPI